MSPFCSVFLSASGSSVCDVVLLPGEFGVFRSFGGFLMVSDTFAGILQLFALLCVYVCMPDASKWFSSTTTPFLRSLGLPADKFSGYGLVCLS